MADHTPNLPLWEVMQAASVEAVFDKNKEDLPVSRVRIAAELRAIAGELESRRDFLVDGYNLSPEGKAIAAWLRAEADRAEAGE